ncbi:hypothetical protein CUMW_067940 [Citrus unshiu]|nr:hypothetical protein CUMW_067940 [Citrus unshiu]
MSGSREESPDWLRSFQAPTHSVLTLSSDSDSDSSHNGNGDGGKNIAELTFEKHMEPFVRISVPSLLGILKIFIEYLLKLSHALVKKVSKEKSPKKGLKSPKKEKDVVNNVKRKGNNDHEDAEEDIAEKRSMLNVSTSTLPLVMSEKLQRTKALVECEGESVDLSGDMGAVGRILVPGTLDGFLFDSEDESDKLAKAMPHQIDQNDGIEEQTNEKTKVKSGPAGKRGTSAGGPPQPPKRARKRTIVSKKAKAKK